MSSQKYNINEPDNKNSRNKTNVSRIQSAHKIKNVSHKRENCAPQRTIQNYLREFKQHGRSDQESNSEYVPNVIIILFL